ncbi:MAG: aquaporin family protein [Chitinophagia bacterium]|nr:aquaporin family protein [Chitinophagia bacterium]
MSPFAAELLGTSLIILFGNGVVANVVLDRTKGHGGGLIAITFGWAIAVFIGVYATTAHSGAHLNPAVSLANAITGTLPWALLPSYLAAQFIGAAIGQLVVWVVYRDHFDATPDPATKLACFSTSPSIRKPASNLATEAIATFVFVTAILFIDAPESSLGALNALPVALLVLGVGLSLGGPTGYAINPARDLGPRLMHAILPIRGKGDSDWAYAWVPVAGPLLGAVLAAMAFPLLRSL